MPSAAAAAVVHLKETPAATGSVWREFRVGVVQDD